MSVKRRICHAKWLETYQVSFFGLRLVQLLNELQSKQQQEQTLIHLEKMMLD